MDYEKATKKTFFMQINFVFLKNDFQILKKEIGFFSRCLRSLSLLSEMVDSEAFLQTLNS